MRDTTLHSELDQLAQHMRGEHFYYDPMPALMPAKIYPHPARMFEMIEAMHNVARAFSIDMKQCDDALLMNLPRMLGGYFESFGPPETEEQVQGAENTVRYLMFIHHMAHKFYSPAPEAQFATPQKGVMSLIFNTQAPSKHDVIILCQNYLLQTYEAQGTANPVHRANALLERCLRAADAELNFYKAMKIKLGL